MLSVKFTGLDLRNIILEWDTFVKAMLNPKGLFNHLNNFQSINLSQFSIPQNHKSIQFFQSVFQFKRKWCQRIKWYDWRS